MKSVEDRNKMLDYFQIVILQELIFSNKKSSLQENIIKGKLIAYQLSSSFCVISLFILVFLEKRKKVVYKGTVSH